MLNQVQKEREGIHSATVKRRLRAKAFRPDGGGSFTATVPGGQGYVYVRVLGIGGQSLSIARDQVGLSSPTDDDAPVWIEPDADGTWAITARRYAG